MQPNTSRPLYKVRHDGVAANHPDESVRKQFAGKKNVTNQVTRYKQSAEKTAKMLKEKGFKNVRIEESDMSGLNFFQLRTNLIEKTLTPAELKKREEVAKAIKREHPGMPMGMKMAIATKTAKRVAEDTEQLDELKGEMHPDAPKVLKHIKPEHHGVYKPFLKKGTYKGNYQDRSAVLSAAEKAGHIKEDIEEIEEAAQQDKNKNWRTAAREAIKTGAKYSPTNLAAYKAAKLKENFASDFLAMAKQKNPSARISTADQRKKEAEELAKKRAHLKPVHAGPTGSHRPLGGYDPKSGRSYSE